ncbi:sulfate adenylyltransferase subunit CysN, partial [Pseudomonas sp. MWU12-2323]|nr:sulfate adenylyltransferase subunit CysN [Pseudomonas sp. MWU12-2323]
QAITLTLEDEIDISRGDMLVRADEAAPHVSQSFDAHLVAMGETPLRPGKEYGFKLAGKYVTGRIESILHRTDVNTLQNGPAEALALNEIGLCRISLNSLAVFDSYRSCRGSGSLIMIDRLSNGTVAAGMIGQTVESAVDSQSPWQRFEQELSQLLRKHYPDMTLAQLAQRLAERAGD